MTMSSSPAPAGPGPERPGASRILVIKLSSLGDLFHALPAVRRLKIGLGARVDWVTQPEYADLVGCFTDVERVLVFPRRGPARRFPEFLRALRRTEYDCVLDLQGLLKSAVVSRLARARRRIGPSFAREGARLFYSAVAAPSGQERHAVMQCLDTAKHLGLDTLPVEFPVRFPKQALTGASPRVALVPFSRWPTKNWPAASFVQLVRRLRERLNAGIFLVGGNDSRGVCGEIERHAGAVENAAGRLTLIQTGSLLAEMDLVIANDSGPMHMAAALGVPVLAIFGPTDPVRTGPYGAKHRVLTAPVPCRPCYRRTCRFGDIRCLAGIRPETVADAAVEMLCR